MPKRPPLPKGHVDGLAKRLADDCECRDRILGNQTLLKWVSPQFTGVVGPRSLRLNVDLMIAVGSILCPQSSTPLALTLSRSRPLAFQSLLQLSSFATNIQLESTRLNLLKAPENGLPCQPCRSSNCARICTWLRTRPMCSAKDTRLGHS